MLCSLYLWTPKSSSSPSGCLHRKIWQKWDERKDEQQSETAPHSQIPHKFWMNVHGISPVCTVYDHFTMWVWVWITAFMGSHSLMLTCFNVRADVLQWLSAELYVTSLLTDPLTLPPFRGLIGYMQIQENFKGRVKGLKCITEPRVWKWECTHTVTHEHSYRYSKDTLKDTNNSIFVCLSPSQMH